MPTQPLRSCTYPGCPTLVARGRCERHKYERRADSRPSASRRGFNAKWRRRRARYLREHPFCEIRVKCRGTRATDVDHKVPQAATGNESDDELQSACHRCHSWKTATSDTRRDQEGQFRAH